MMVRFFDLRTIPVTWWTCVENFGIVYIKKKVTGSCSHSHLAKLLSRPTSLNIGLGLFLFTSDHFILFFTKSHVRRLIFLVQIFLYQICDKRQHVMYNVQCWAKNMMYRQEQSISLTSFLSWFKLDRKCIYNLYNLAAGFCAVHNNPSVAKTWTLNRLGKSIWSYYWHFLSNLNNTRKPLVKPATGWGRRHVSAMCTCGVWQTARSKLLRIHSARF